MVDNNFLLDDFNPISIAESIAKRMIKRRLFHNMTQKTLAERSGVSLGSIRRFETSGEISLKHLLNIALVLDSLFEFKDIFPEEKYNSIDDILKNNELKERKRAYNA